MKSVVNVGKGQMAGWTRINRTSHFAGCDARGMAARLDQLVIFVVVQICSMCSRSIYSLSSIISMYSWTKWLVVARIQRSLRW